MNKSKNRIIKDRLAKLKFQKMELIWPPKNEKPTRIYPDRINMS